MTDETNEPQDERAEAGEAAASAAPVHAEQREALG
jgi:hypothetical protein